MAIHQLGKYELIEELGRGGYGTVYRAREVVLDVERAVKVLHPALVSDPEFIARFRQEARTAARLEHPNIVSVYELDEVEGSYFLVMRYLPGGSLKDLLVKEGRLSFERSLAITQQVAAALDFAHNRPEQLIHRDVKPGNILFETEDHVRLTDFGFAKALSGASSASLSATGGMIGTPAYMAPEVWRGKGASPATDVYSLACVFAEMLTGQALFQGASPPEIMTKHILDGPELPETWNGDIPTGVNGVLRAALDRDAAARTVTPGAFLISLNGLDTRAQESERLAAEQKSAQEEIEKARQEAESQALREADDQARKEAEIRQEAQQVAGKINQLQQEVQDAIDEQAWGEAAFSIGSLASLGEEGEAAAKILRKKLSQAQEEVQVSSRKPKQPVDGGAPPIYEAVQRTPVAAKSMSGQAKSQKAWWQQSWLAPSVVLAGVVFVGIVLIVVSLVLLSQFSQPAAPEVAVIVETVVVTRTPNLAATKAIELTETSQARTQATATARAQKTAKAQATRTARVQATATKKAQVTRTARAQATAQMRVTSTAQAASNEVVATLDTAMSVFGPEEGELEHIEDDYIETSYSDIVDLSEFLVGAFFYNPYSTSKGEWDYGFLITSDDVQYRLSVTSNHSWHWLIRRRVDGEWQQTETIMEGWEVNLDDAPSGGNSLFLSMHENVALFFLNTEYIITLDVPEKMNSGDIAVGTGFLVGDEIAGEVTRFENFQVWEP